jgi:hypothetical protein
VRVEKVIWLDSGFHISEGWRPVMETLADFRYDDMKVISAGIVVYEDDEIIGISATYSFQTEAAYGLQLIAKSNIISREVLADATFE